LIILIWRIYPRGRRSRFKYWSCKTNEI